MAYHLEDFSTEIHVLLLCHLDSIETLFALLRTSRRLLQVYRGSRDVVYSNVVRNQITPQFLPAAITALNLRELGLATTPSIYTETFHRTLDSSSIPVADWKRLFRFQCIVDDTIRDLTQTTLQALGRHNNSIHSDALSTALSGTEHHRMLRAFYNRELLSSICAHYLHAVTDTPSDAEDYLRCLGSFLATWALHEFEESLFVIHYLRKQLVRYKTQAEDDRFEQWKANGPYAWRYEFETGHQWVWSMATEYIPDFWLRTTLYGADLAAIHDIVSEREPTARMARLEAHDIGYYPSEHWDRIEEQIKHYRTLPIDHLSSPLLPHDWRSCAMPRLDLASCRFTDTADGPNLGLLWGCRRSVARRPQFHLLDGMAVWGAAIWDSDRLQNMKILGNHPADVSKEESFYWSESGETYRRSVESRAHEVEKVWIAQGLTKDEWYHG